MVGVVVKDIDFVIVVMVMFDMLFLLVGVLIVDEFGMLDVVVYDFSVGCIGFVYVIV